MKDSQIWLTKNFDPKSEVLVHWRNAYPLRRLSDSTTILEYFEKWPILKTEIAPELVNILVLLMFHCLHKAYLDLSIGRGQGAAASWGGRFQRIKVKQVHWFYYVFFTNTLNPYRNSSYRKLSILGTYCIVLFYLYYCVSGG